MPEFTNDAIKRIQTTVKAYEQSVKNPQAPRGAGPTFSDGSFFAKINDVDYSDESYGWIAVSLNADFDWEEHSEWGEAEAGDDDSAVEINGFMFVPEGSIVRLLPTYESDAYTFIWNEYVANGILDEDIASGSSGDVSIYFDDDDTGENVEAKNRGGDLTEDTKVEVRKIGEDWFIVTGSGNGGNTYNASLTATLSGGSTASVGSVTAIGGGDGPSVTSVANPLGWYGSSGDKCVIVGSGEDFVLLVVEWDVIPRVKNVFDDDPEIKQTKQDIIGKVAGSDSDSTIIDTQPDCPS